MQKELWDEGYDKDTRKYIGSKWGKYVRAPEIFFKVLEKGRGKFVPLKEIADVRFGIKTGANEFFYLTEAEIERWGIEREFWMHKEDDQWVPNYIIKSPRECKSIVVKPEELKYRVLMIHKDKKDLKGTNVLKYIKAGERRGYHGYHRRPTCASRGKRWYDLGEWKISRNILAMFERERKYCFWNDTSALIDAALYWVYLKEKEYEKLICGALNSTLFGLWKELVARPPEGGGGGPIQIKVYDYGNMLIPAIKEMETVKTKIEQALDNLSKREIGTIFSELGANSLDEVSLNKVKPDRRQLDKLVMGDILGLTDEEQLEVYRAVIDLVKSRIDKAKSVGRRKKIKDGVDIEAFVKTVMERVGEETLGKFFQEKVLSHKPLVSRNLPQPSGEIKVESDFEGYRLYYGKKYILCATQSEARYLKVWLETGLEMVKIPKDKACLARIVPGLEKLMREIKKIIESHTDSILQPKLRQKILHQLWQSLTEGV